MKTILVVNGEKYWQDLLPEFEVVQKRIQHTSWVLKEGELHVIDKESVVKPDCILWRVGAIKPSEIQRTALNLIEIAQVPCINSPQTLKRGYDRLSMLAALKKCELPLISFDVVTQSTRLKHLKMPFPFVVKAGNYHGGYGKVLVKDEEKWLDIQDLLFITDEYITVEPYINYKKDIRYICIGDKVWAMSRRGKFWKANVETSMFKVIQPKEAECSLYQKTSKLLGSRYSSDRYS